MIDEAAGTPIVVIVDDDDAVKESLELLLQSAGYRSCSHPSGEELLRQGPPAGPACLVLDLDMPGMTGIDVQERIARAGWNIPIIFLTGHGDVPAAVRALKGGAVDFLQKCDMQPADLLERIERCVAAHERTMLEREAQDRQQQQFARLTCRELEVARLASAGMTNRVIGLELGISERTVEVHRGRAMKKLGLRTAAQLARLESVLQAFH